MVDRVFDVIVTVIVRLGLSTPRGRSNWGFVITWAVLLSIAGAVVYDWRTGWHLWNATWGWLLIAAFVATPVYAMVWKYQDEQRKQEMRDLARRQEQREIARDARERDADGGGADA